MTRRSSRHLLIAAILVLALGLPLAAQAPAQTPDRYLDAIPAGDTHVRLVVFNPETFNIRALMALRKNGIIDIPNLTVIGVYHEKQTGDFAASRRFVADAFLDWFKFHVVTADIGEPDLFKKNACVP